MFGVVAAVVFAAGPSGTAVPAAAHDVHVCQTRLVQDARQVLLRIRCFRNDLDSALVLATRRRDRRVGSGAGADSAVRAYVAQHVTVRVNGRVVSPSITAAGQEDDGTGEPAWWMLVAYDAGAPVRSLGLRQGMLLEVFPRQQNLVSAMRARDEARASLYFAAGADREVAVEFGS